MDSDPRDSDSVGLDGAFDSEKVLVWDHTQNRKCLNSSNNYTQTKMEVHDLKS